MITSQGPDMKNSLKSAEILPSGTEVQGEGIHTAFEIRNACFTAQAVLLVKRLLASREPNFIDHTVLLQWKVTSTGL